MKRLTEHMGRLDRLGVTVNTGVACQEIRHTGLVVQPEHGSARLLAADNVILAGSAEPSTELFEAIRKHVPEAHAIGDCTGLGLIRKATQEATRVACTI